MREELLKEKTKEEVMSDILKELVNALASSEDKDGNINPFKVMQKEMELCDKLQNLISPEILTDDDIIRNERLEFAYNCLTKVDELLNTLGV